MCKAVILRSTPFPKMIFKPWFQHQSRLGKDLENKIKPLWEMFVAVSYSGGKDWYNKTMKVRFHEHVLLMHGVASFGWFARVMTSHSRWEINVFHLEQNWYVMQWSVTTKNLQTAFHMKQNKNIDIGLSAKTSDVSFLFFKVFYSLPGIVD